jgi:Glycosyltransferase family 87
MNGPSLNPRMWLSCRRVRIHGLLIGLVFWSVYVWIMATPGLRDRNGFLKGTDFLHYYVLGTLALEHRGMDLYNMRGQTVEAMERVPASGQLVYLPLYGPQVSLLFAPLARLPYAWALTVWLAASAAIYALCCYAIWRACPMLRVHRGTMFLLAAAYPAFVHLIVWGQNSALPLLCFTLAYLALRFEKPFPAGLALGCLVFKPQLAVAAVAVFLLSGQMRVIAGMLLAASAQLSMGWLYYGTPAMKDYAWHLFHVGGIYPLLEPRPYHVHSLRAFWAMLIPWPSVAFALCIATALPVLAIAVQCWKSPAPLSLRYSALLMATVLVSPHITVYDLVILAPAFLLLADWAMANDNRPRVYAMGLLLYFCYVVPLTVPITQWTHVQLSVPALLALLWLVWKSTSDERSFPIESPTTQPA